MKLLIATPLYPPEIGGPATYAKLLEEGLPSKGIEVELVKFSEVRHLPKIIRHYVYYRRVLKAARHADVILALDPVSVGLPAMYAAKKVGKPFIVKIVGDYAWEQGQQRFGVVQTLDDFVETSRVPFLVHILRYIQTRVARNATRIIVPSLYLKSVVETWGISREIIEVIHNAVSFIGHGALPERLINLPRPTVVTVGRLVPWKQIHGLIDIIDQLHQKQTFAFLLVIGDGPERENLEAYANQKLGTHCLFTGALSHDDTLAAMGHANILALNSSYEGLSHTLIEAQMLGTPIVATDVGGNAEIIENGTSGLLVPCGDQEAFVDALEHVILDGSIRARLITGAKQSAKRFTTDTMLSTTAECIKALCKHYSSQMTR